MGDENLLLSMYSHSKKEINEMFDSGVFNEIAKGYMLKTLVNSNVERDKVMEFLNGLKVMFDEVTAAKAREFYINY